MSAKKKILVIYFNPDSLENTRLTVIHHLKVLEYLEGNNDISYLNVNETFQSFMRNGQFSGLRPLDISKTWDAIILHYSFLSVRTIGYQFRELKKYFYWIRDLKGLKIAIPQDEGDYAGLLDEWLFELGTNIIFSVHYTSERPLYPIMRNYASIYPCLPGYIDEKTAIEIKEKIKPIAARKNDIVYRARRLPLWFGGAGRFKYRIAEVTHAIAIQKGFNVDISINIEDSIPGPLWLEFMSSGKTVLGVQGGYSTIDWRGEIKAQVLQILDKNPDIDHRLLDEKMPAGWDDYSLFTITPRHFEAIITNTCQILVSGDYKGVLQPDIHYIPIKSDWTNIDEALERIRDTHEVQKIADRARKDILHSGKYSYRSFAKTLERVMHDHHHSKGNPTFTFHQEDVLQKILCNLDRQFIDQRNELAAMEAHLRKHLEKNYNLESQLDCLIKKVSAHYGPDIKKWLLRIMWCILSIIFVSVVLFISFR
jgi:hypothetical protein